MNVRCEFEMSCCDDTFLRLLTLNRVRANASICLIIVIAKKTVDLHSPSSVFMYIAAKPLRGECASQ